VDSKQSPGRTVLIDKQLIGFLKDLRAFWKRHTMDAKLSGKVMVDTCFPIVHVLINIEHHFLDDVLIHLSQVT